MAVYRFATPSPIDEITVIKTGSGATRAYLHARTDLPENTLNSAKNLLNGKGWQYVPTLYEGAHVLEVRGFQKDAILLGALGREGYVQGAPNAHDLDSDHISSKDRLKKATLRLSGFAYFAGDVGFATYGYKGGSVANAMAGLFYFFGSLSLALFGKSDQSVYQVQDTAEKMRRFLAEEKITIPGDSALHRVTQERPRSAGQKILDVLRQYPAEIMNSCFAVAGLLIIVAVRGELKELAEKLPVWKNLGNSLTAGTDKQFMQELVDGIPHRKIAKGIDIGLGSLTILSGLTSALMTEKPRDPTKPRRTGIMGIWDWVREKPLRVAGYGYIGSTLCHAVSTGMEIRQSKDFLAKYNNASFSHPDVKNIFTDECKEAQGKLDSLYFRALFVIANLIAEFLMSISSKGHGEGVKSDGSIEQSVYALAADTISRIPNQPMRETLVDHIAGRLASADALGGSAEQHAAGIRAILGSVAANPWRDAQATAARAKAQAVAQTASRAAGPAPESPSPLLPSRELPSAAWQDRVKPAAAAQGAPSIQPAAAL